MLARHPKFQTKRSHKGSSISLCSSVMQYTSLSQFIITYFDIRLQLLLLSRYDSIPIGMLGGLWSYSVLSLNPRNADCRLIADESYLLSIFLFLFSFILHITVLRLLFTGRVPIALRCWDYPVFLIFIFILFLCATIIAPSRCL